jgi:hypothetical protein
MTRLILIPILSLLNINTSPNFNVNYNNNYNKFNCIAYNINKKLKWEDFSERSGNYKVAALTASVISYSVTDNGKYLDIKVFCYFDKKQSIVVTGNKKDYILNHEQRHFDITYIYAIKFVNELKKEKELTYDKISSIYDDVNLQWNEYQNIYDLETRNSRDKDIQAIWDKKIQDQLDNL